MSELSQREKVLILVMLALMITLLAGLILNKLSNYTSQLTYQYTSKQKQLEDVKKLEQDLIYLHEIPTAPIMPSSLSSYVERIARVLQVHDQLQLNVLTSNPPGMEGVQVRIDKMNLNQLFGALYMIEKERPVLLIEQLDISISPGTRLLRASFRVYKQFKS
jgi:type II secretory pathway component PulM